MNFFSRRSKFDDEMRDTLAQRLREIPPTARTPNEFAPTRGAYSLERVADFLHQHITDLDAAELRLGEQAETVKEQLAEIERQRTVTKTARDVFADALAKLPPKLAAPDARPIYVKPTITEITGAEATS